MQFPLSSCKNLFESLQEIHFCSFISVDSSLQSRHVSKHFLIETHFPFSKLYPSLHVKHSLFFSPKHVLQDLSQYFNIFNFSYK
jgi:hypothetical protein